MTDRARIDLADLQAELLIPDSSNRNRRRVAGESLKRFPRDPVVLYAYIASHIRDATQWSTPDGHRTRYPWTLGRALASAFDLLAQPPAATGAIRTALSRVGNVAAALLALEDRPPREADEDFAFLPDYLEARDLRWAFDPLVLLPEFQHWALQRIHREREADGARPARASAAIEFDCVESYRNYATVSDKQMPALILGRLLAALVVGRPNLLSNAWRLSQFKLPCSAACLRALFAAGLDPDASLKDGHTL
ncbi:MAG: hypothetical protein JF591_01000, partial [Lysobacter sp.]|nr:hypothetical protein [Lysobacter sp.]